jgi:plastocyanin
MVLQLDATKGTAGTVTGLDGWPRYAPSTITVPAGKPVTLMITNYDDANTPLAAGQPYNTVQGGRETVNGKPVTFISNKVIAHTFTVPGLHLNAPIPMETAGGGLSNTITFTFTPHKRGTYTFQCFTPCGSGKNGVGGPMMKQGFMQGTLIVS